MVTHLPGMSKNPPCPSLLNEAGDLPTGQHLPRGMGESQAEGHKGWGRAGAQQLCTVARTGEEEHWELSYFLLVAALQANGTTAMSPLTNDP